MRVDGRCHCGRVTYEADVDYNDVSLCHCTDCQVLCGSPWRASVPAEAASFRLWCRSALSWASDVRALPAAARE